MMLVRTAVIASIGFVLGSPPVTAQGPLGYREYALGASVTAVVTASRAHPAAVKTLHERPAKIQQLDWRVPYGRSGSDVADPVRDIQFSFYDDQLYQLIVTYDRDRTAGMTDEDIVESLSAIYGPPLLGHRALQAVVAEFAAESTVIAQWEDAGTLLTLTRDTYRPLYQLELLSKALGANAKAAITEALLLDRREAPQREIDRRKKVADDALLAGQKARVINKAAFRP